VKEVRQLPGEIVKVVFEAAFGDGGGKTVEHKVEPLIELGGFGHRTWIELFVIGW
jgi:hypothetical protein